MIGGEILDNFEAALINTIQDRILSGISKQELVTVEYGDRIRLPSQFIRDVYEALNIENIKRRLVANLESEMADKIANKLITEYANDIKQIMGNKELREDLRHYVRERIRAIATSPKRSKLVT